MEHLAAVFLLLLALAMVGLSALLSSVGLWPDFLATVGPPRSPVWQRTEPVMLAPCFTGPAGALLAPLDTESSLPIPSPQKAEPPCVQLGGR